NRLSPWLRDYLPQHDRAALTEAYDMDRVLRDLDTHTGDRRAGWVSHGLLLACGSPCQRRWLPRPERAPTISLPAVRHWRPAFSFDRLVPTDDHGRRDVHAHYRMMM